MLKSMTGFGRGEYEDEQFSVTIEMKTVNHRYNEVAIRLPRFLNPVEDRIRKTILKSVNRGRIDVFINASYTNTENVSIKVDKALVLAYHNALRDVGSAIGCEDYKLNEQSEILYLSRCPDVINAQEGFFDVESVWPKLEQALRQAISNLVAMRETEGSNIYGDFIKRADLIAEKLAVIEERSPQVVEEYQTRLSDRINELLAKHNQVIEPERLLQEVAIFADRTSITEEIVRLKSHIKQFRLIIDADQPVGRKLDFLIQEFNREANTIASKANDYTLAQVVVEIKAEIEKIREQIQNLEYWGKGESMDIKLINIGFGNIVAANRIISIISPESAPIKRIIQEARDRGMLIDATYGRRTRAVIVTDSGHIILSAVQPETVANRLVQTDDEDEE